MSHSPDAFSPCDHGFMRAALSLAARGLGRVWPNPAVGCVLVGPDGTVISRGWTQPPDGRPHGERVALDRAGNKTRGATAYVTLEPCSHQGRTPPCADALIQAGITRVVVAMEDPDSRVNGQGIARLRRAGLRVDVGLMEAEARDLNLGFVLNRTRSRPLVTLKIASTLDGKIATANGESQWITGAEARAQGHLLRATHDAIAVGLGTVLADDPVLTCRLPGLEDRSPVRVLFDSRGRLSPKSALVRSLKDGAPPVWLMTTCEDGNAALSFEGVDVLCAPKDDLGRPSIPQALGCLADLGITRLLVEGGALLAASFLRAGVVDRLVWFRSNSIIGNDGLGAVATLSLESLKNRPFFDLVDTRAVGRDRIEHYVARAIV